MKKINVGWGGHREESKIINKFHSQWKKIIQVSLK